MTSSESETGVTRKRQRTSSTKSAGADESKRHRGRPRVDPQDETAADKRRTQIRLAQRAYRQRKETTIGSLKKQVSDLQSIIEEMNKSFLNFNDTAVNLGILQAKPELAQALRNATEQFITLAKTANSGDEENGDDAETPESNASKTKSSQDSAAISGGDREPPKEPTPQKQRTVDIGMGYTKTFYDASSSPRPSNLESHDAFPLTGSPDQNFVQSNDASITTSNNYNLTQYHAFMPSPPGSPLGMALDAWHKTVSVPQPLTFSFNETTFARRLHRAAIESGYQLLANADVRTTLFKHVFKLSLLYNTPEQIFLKFRSILLREPTASLEFWQTPFIHLGGAGTHYPRRDETGALIGPKNSWQVRSIGPMRSKIGRARLESGQGAGDAGIDLDLEGFDGEWFDSNDVQGYLEEKGIFIQPRASFAEAEYVDIDGLTGTGDGFLVSMPTDEEDLTVGRSCLRNASMNLGSSADQGMDYFSPNESPPPTFLTKGAQMDLLSQPTITGAPELKSSSFTPPSTDLGFDPQIGLLGDVMDNSNLEFGDLAAGVPSLGSFSNIDIDTSEKISNAWFDDFSLYEESSISKSGSSVSAGTSAGTPSPPAIRMPLPRVGDSAFAGTGKDRAVRRKVVIDVPRFVDELIMRAVCLGRAPGFRRRDVDRAFERSIIQMG
ncbi:hypothetical protein P152DRAFT_451072 [Eremomyces bilateralis CBS 781.70]|uniref:BZIP domain-containing protein n=1 Tax=Eremomyces bilateralis CBS 781.70 TaxID=1392243 RepID=A0A6G1FYT4_9PEZI|nr:uncharacterized protein P152DRAFT_451072 [Eremomyces bilateralis CBS 781.70]KAF1810719.1 hypothetical protein P152DRAFT_451072 [Eremomyces bilateralis CBS 781.70]